MISWLVQVWKLQPAFREEVDEALKILKSHRGPTIAFHGEGPSTSFLIRISSARISARYNGTLSFSIMAHSQRGRQIE